MLNHKYEEVSDSATVPKHFLERLLQILAYPSFYILLTIMSTKVMISYVGRKIAELSLLVLVKCY
jgi:hypothetical protein